MVERQKGLCQPKGKQVEEGKESRLQMALGNQLIVIYAILEQRV